MKITVIEIPEHDAMFKLCHECESCGQLTQFSIVAEDGRVLSAGQEKVEFLGGIPFKGDRFCSVDPVEYAINHRLNWTQSKDFWAWKTVNSILVDLGFEKITNSEVTKAGIIFGRLGVKQKKSNGIRFRLVPTTLRGQNGKN